MGPLKWLRPNRHRADSGTTAAGPDAPTADLADWPFQPALPEPGDTVDLAPSGADRAPADPVWGQPAVVPPLPVPAAQSIPPIGAATPYGSPLTATWSASQQTTALPALGTDPTSSDRPQQVVPVDGECAGAPSRRPGLSRVTAAEVGIYIGGALVATAAAGGIIAGWPGWSTAVRSGVVGVCGLGLLAAGLWLRGAQQSTQTLQPGGDEDVGQGMRLRDARRRATSVLLVAGIAVLFGGGALAAGGVPESAPWAGTILAGVALGLMLVGDQLASSPVSQTMILVAAASGIAALPAALQDWRVPALVGLGCAWAVLGWRYLAARNTAVAAGIVLALGATVWAANGVWAWPARGVLLVMGACSSAAFLRGGRNAWLALGVASWAALAATAAGAVVGPLPALLVGGLATLLVSLVALRKATREPDTRR